MKILGQILLSGFLAVASANANQFEDLVKNGDQHAVRYEEEKALSYYLTAEKIEPNNGDLLASISKEYRHLMSEAKGRSEKLRLGNIALDYATRAASADPQSSSAQLAPAITLGKLVPLMKGNGEKLEASREIKKSAERALALDRKNDTAWFVLGRWHQGFAGMSAVKRKLGGIVHGEIPNTTYADAADCFRKAVALNPKRAMHHVELGCAYHGMGNHRDAKKAIQHGLSLPETEKDDPTTKAHGRKVLEELEN